MPKTPSYRKRNGRSQWAAQVRMRKRATKRTNAPISANRIAGLSSSWVMPECGRCCGDPRPGKQTLESDVGIRAGFEADREVTFRAGDAFLSNRSLASRVTRRPL